MGENKDCTKSMLYLLDDLHHVFKMANHYEKITLFLKTKAIFPSM